MISRLWTRWWRSHFRTRGVRRGSRNDQRRTFQPCLESLEARALPTGGTAASVTALFPTAPHPIVLDNTGSGSQVEVIAVAGGTDLVRFLAPRTGRMLVHSDPVTFDLRGTLTVFDAAGQQLAQGSTVPDLVQFLTPLRVDVTAGQTYYIQVVADPLSRGSFLLSLSPGIVTDDGSRYDDDYGSTPEQAPVVMLDATGAGTQAGSINYPSDTDTFRFVAQRTGIMTVHQEPAAGSLVSCSLVAYDGAFTGVAADAGLDAGEVVFRVTAGQTYYVTAGAAFFGAYLLT